MSTSHQGGDATPDPTPRVETLREHLQEALSEISWGIVYDRSPEAHQRFIERHLEAALAILDAAKRGDHGAYPYSPGPIREFVYVHDPETTRTQASRASSLRGRHDGIPGTAWSDS